jgi:hypothetical protein
MTALSTLFPASGGGVPYPSGKYELCSPVPTAFADSPTIANTDYLFPYIPRSDVTVDSLWFQRRNTTAGSVALAMYDKNGNRLDDCAVDTDTTVGFHEISSTNFDLTAGELYYWLLNASAAVIEGDSHTTSFNMIVQSNLVVPIVDGGLFSGGTAPTGAHQVISGKKTRTTAAPIDPLTMTGWSGSDQVFHGGFIVA